MPLVKLEFSKFCGVSKFLTVLRPGFKEPSVHEKVQIIEPLTKDVRVRLINLINACL